MVNPLDIISAPTGAVVDKVDDVLNPDQKAKLSTILARNGWGPANSASNGMARAVVQRESSGKADAVNSASCSATGDNAVGIFQVCTIHKGKMGIPADKEKAIRYLKDPDNNARVAKILHRTAGWQPWSSSGGNPQPTDWDPEITTDKDTVVTGAGEVASAVASPFGGIATAAVDLIGSLLSRDTWFRIGKGWLGGVFVITGTGALVFIIANQASGGRAASVVKQAATKGVVK